MIAEEAAQIAPKSGFGVLGRLFGSVRELKQAAIPAD
jgi:hypothetical protein